MAFGLRHTGTFYSTNGVMTRVNIFVDGYSGAADELSFRGDEPLNIEWEDTSKEDVVCGSVATLGIISPGDRTYADLYTIKAGAIRMDVYRDGALYWSGTLDPEFYEEPYSTTEDYEVELVFSDFGILERLKWTMTGMQTLGAIVKSAIARSCINFISIDETRISTQLTDTSGQMKLEDISVRGENFYDEDNEASTLKDVLEGILQPLALRMIQRHGTVWIYDLNGLMAAEGSKAVRWMSDDQMMGTDKVANDVKITFSPYAKATQTQEAVYKGTSDVSLPVSDMDPDVKEYYPSTENAWIWKFTGGSFDFDDLSFKIFNSKKGSGLAEISSDARYFKVKPIFGGEECEGVAYGYKYLFGWSGGGLFSNSTPVYTNCTTVKPVSNCKTDSGELMKTHKIYIPKVSDPSKLRIRLMVPMLLDARYNPFEDAGDNNEKSDYDALKTGFTIVYINTQVKLLDAAGGTVATFDNTAVDGNTQPLMNKAGQAWKYGSADGVCRLEYYDKDDLQEGCGVLGWKNNRHYIGVPNSSYVPVLRASMKAMDDGQYIPYPTQGGWLEVTVKEGIHAMNFTHHGDPNHYEENTYDYDKIKWLLYKAPEIDIVDASSVKMSDVESDDIEYKGVINTEAKDDIEIETVCGTMKNVCPTAKGCYYKTSDNLQIQTLYRAGQTNQCERLLIGTLHSQYATRHVKLAGTTEILGDGLITYTEAMQTGKKFIVTADAEDLGDDTSDMTMVELSADNYEPAE
jgi:hypothetical protein